MNQPTPSKAGGSGVLGRIRQRGQPKENLAADAAVDHVAGVPTRRELVGELATAVQISKNNSSLAVLAFVQVGQLREINDVYGPDAGDAMLRLAASRLQTIDVPGTKVLRYEGAVLAVIFQDVPNLAGAEETARFLVELMAPPFLLGTDQITVGSNVGAAISTDNYEALDDMDDGLGAWHLHDETKRTRHTTRVDERRLHRAVENGEFLLHYQPIIRLATGEIVGVEALLRWSQPGATNVGMLFPHDFLPLLEKSGLIVTVGQWVLEEACRQIAEWVAMFPERPDLFVGCNIGARQLIDTTFRDGVLRAVASAHIQPSQLCLDLTEEALRFNRFQREAVWSSLRALKDAGVKLGLDDFGTGMASLSHLRDFRLDLLRFHRVFVAGLGVAREDEVIIRHVTSMAHDLGCVSVAEGVETPKQQVILRDLGVDLAQGFQFGRPLTASQLTERLRPSDAPKPEDPWDSSKVFESEQS
jgi:diguanylate cyclase (GGDEF)-like protein